MSYIETPLTTRYSWYVRLLFWLQHRRYGRELEPTRLWGRTPRAFLAMVAMYAALDRRSLLPTVQIRVNLTEFESGEDRRIRGAVGPLAR